MKLIQEIILLLGSPYTVKKIDQEDVIYRKLDKGYEFEVSKISNKTSVLYVWSTDPRELVGIYEKIPTEYLKDILGYYAVRYQNLTEQFQVLREDQIR